MIGGRQAAESFVRRGFPVARIIAGKSRRFRRNEDAIRAAQ